MTTKEVMQIIDKQASIHKQVVEQYEIEACEILVYDAILDHCMENQISIWGDNPQEFKYDQPNHKEERWQIIAGLFANLLSEEKKPKANPKIIGLLNYYHDKFWT